MAQNLIELVELVEQMRHHQREYFRTRSASVLKDSKAAEHRVDKWLREFREPRQPTLFDEPTNT